MKVRWQTSSGCLAIVALTFVVYLPAIQGGYVFDDNTYVTDNPSLRTTAGLLDIWRIPPATPQYYPLVFTTFWLEYRLWELAPLGYHLVNVLLHAATALLLWRVLRRLEIPVAWLAAAVFAVHPVHVESVAWITERKNVLSGFFYLLAILAWWNFEAGRVTRLAHGRTPTAGLSWRWYGVSLALFCAALLSKTVVCTLPIALVLIVWWKRGRLAWSDVWPVLPMLGLAVMAGVVTAWVEKYEVGAGGSEFTWSLSAGLIIAGRAVWFYAGKLVWPAHLAFIYPRWELDAGRVSQFLYPFSAAALPVVAWLARKRFGRGPVVAVLFFIVTLAPVLGFIPVYAMRYAFVADHWQYHASMGLIPLFVAALFAGVSWLLTTLKRRFPGKQTASHHVSRGKRAPTGPVGAGPSAMLLVSLILLVPLSVITWRQAGTYRDIETFWRATLKNNPSAWMAHNNLGDLLMTQDRVPEALDHFREAVRLHPGHYVARSNLGAALSRLGRVDEAIEQYRQASRIQPAYPFVHNNLGVALSQRGRFDEAIASYHKAIELDPKLASARRNLGMALESNGRIPEAIEQYRVAVDLDARDVLASNNLAWHLATYADSGLRNGGEAISFAESACRGTSYGAPDFLQTLAAAYAEAGRFDDAVQTAERSRQIALAQGKTQAAKAADEMIDLFRQHRALREPLPTSRPSSSSSSVEAATSSQTN